MFSGKEGCDVNGDERGFSSGYELVGMCRYIACYGHGKQRFDRWVGPGGDVQLSNVWGHGVVFKLWIRTTKN